MSTPAERGIASGYSLWLVDRPTSRLHQELNGLIQEAAAHYGTHPFKSHVTLLGGIQWDDEQLIEQTTARLAQEMRPVLIQFENFGSTGHHFLRFFATVKWGDKFIPYHRLAAARFGSVSGTPYQPHHSFVYGDLSAAQVQELEQCVASRFPLPQYFLAQDLELWLTEGPVHEWRLVQTFPLFPRVD